MFKNRQKHYLLISVFFLLLVDIFFVRLDWKNSHRGLTLAMLNVGQGDSLFVESPTGTQILIDGGPARKVISQLNRIMSPFDKEIDAFIITNPDQDHIGGFLDVLKMYKVGRVFEPGTLNDSKTFQNLKTEIKNKNIPNILARKGMRLDMGGGAIIDILFPDREVSAWAVNDGSVVARLTYGQTSILLAGDATTKTEKIILGENSKAALKSVILKVGHHGSRTSTSAEFVKAVSPDYAMISNGQNNKYDHPHQDTLDILAQFGARIFRTDLLGSVIMKSDGEKETFLFQK